MSIWTALLLGIVQGFTEFLPVSSSGHLTLVQSLTGHGSLVSFDLALHLGTLLALILLLRRDIAALSRRSLLLLFVATLPLLCVPLIKRQIEALYELPELLGFFFIATGGILYLGERLGRPKDTPPTLKSGLFIGVMQLIALLPGISRSGSTISGARILGWEREQAVRFSFLLAIPTILGGTLLQLIQGDMTSDIPIGIYAVGFLTSFVTGLFGLWLFLRMIKRGRLMPFVWYCLALGAVSLVYFNVVHT